MSLWFAPASARAADWPMWRYDAGRTAASPETLSETLHLQWVRELPVPRPAWPPDQHKIQFDLSYEPVVAGGRMFVPSMVRDRVTALDAGTGEEVWRFYTSGPVRFAPVVENDRVYVVSDDGYLYCLDAATGRLQWKRRGGPSDRWLLGNERMISAWPARGAPVVYEGEVYFAASIWPFMGTFVYALDPATGDVRWCNSGSGSVYMMQQHHSEAFAGVAPQGYLAATAERLMISGGRTVPGGYDRRTGEFLYFHVEDRSYGKDAGGYPVYAAREWFFNGRAMYKLADGAGMLEGAAEVLTDESVYRADGRGKIIVHALKPTQETYVDRKGKEQTRVILPKQWEVATEPEVLRLFCKAGPRLYGGGKEGLVAAIDLPVGDRAARVSWTGRVEGTPWNMLAADGKLFVVTREGEIWCFGAEERAVRRHSLVVSDDHVTSGDMALSRARRMLKETGQRDGYCLVTRVSNSSLVRALAEESKLHVVGLCPEEGVLDALRLELDESGLYGERIALLAGDMMSVKLPPYFASLVICDESVEESSQGSDGFAGRVFSVLRPYGGVAWFDAGGQSASGWVDVLEGAGLDGEMVTAVEDGVGVILERRGALPGAGDWTHQYSDAGNSVVSADRLAKAPLGLLWFGGPSNAGVLPRHGHGPSPQVVGGRLFIEGPNVLRAVDVYTGRLLWEKDLAGVGKYYDNTSHEPGANAIGSNYVSMADGVYVAYGQECLRLDPTTGETISRFKLPPMAEGEEPPEWGYIGVWEDLLLAGAHPLTFWLPDFDPDEFKDEKPEKLHKTLDVLGTFRGWGLKGPDPGEDEKALRRYVAANLNRLLMERGLFGRIPRELRAERLNDEKRAAKVRDLRRQIEAHVRTTDEEPRYDMELWRLNRQLLSEFCSLPGLRGPSEPGKSGLNRTASERLVAMDRYTGRVRWTFGARYALRHNAIALGGARVYVIDRLPDDVVGRMERRGRTPPGDARVVALDAKTGDEVWSLDENVFGTWLGYSVEHDLLVQAGSRNRDRAHDEVGRGIEVYRATDGDVLWHSDMEYSGPVLLHHDTLLTQETALELLTGEQKMRRHPVTGREVPWRFQRNYGCNSAIASEHLLTFRSAAAGYYDLAGDSGTGNLGGFRSGCTSNLIAADGVLNAPDYTRTCTCSYQNQTSLAAIHSPDVEMWTFTAIGRDEEAPVQRVGINFGAPGDRQSDDGTLWLEYPAVGGPSPDVPVKVEPEGVRWFRHHSSIMQGGALPWVAASGVTGLREVRVSLGSAESAARSYSVALHFAEPEGRAAGERVFDVRVQDQVVLDDFDIAAAAGEAMRGVSRTVRGVSVTDELVVQLEPAGRCEPVLCGIEIVAEREGSAARAE
jgi:outer membrane protein assembly factor BamB